MSERDDELRAKLRLARERIRKAREQKVERPQPVAERA